MSQLVPCPNGGKCGSMQHLPESSAYRACAVQTAKDMRLGSSSSISVPPPGSHSTSWPGMTLEIKEFGPDRVETWTNENGDLQDPPDGTPAYREFYPNGMIKKEEHYQSWKLQDPTDGNPAIREFFPSGKIYCEEHYQSGELHDPSDGGPAIRRFYENGTIELECHHQDWKPQDPFVGEPAYQDSYEDEAIEDGHYQGGQRTMA